MRINFTDKLIMGVAMTLLLAGSAMAESQVLETARKAGCLACHGISKKIVGPAFAWVSYKYKDDKERGKKAIVDAIANGSEKKWVIAWGAMMPPMKGQTTDQQRNDLADYILGLDPVAPPER